MNILFVIIIVILIIVVTIQKAMINALSLYILENEKMPDKQILKKYSTKAIKKMLHMRGDE